MIDQRIVIVAVVFALAVVVTGVMAQDAVSGDLEEYTEQSQEWCDDHGGMLYNAQSVHHGGLHCKLDNGTTVHMTEVIET